MARYDCVDRVISETFYTYGKFVYRHKLLFLLLPLAMILLSATGFSRFKLSEEVQYLFTPEGCKSFIDLEFMKNHFMSGNEGTGFIPNREIDVIVRRGRLIITALDGGNLMKEDVIREILELDDRLQSFGVNVDENFESHIGLTLDSTNTTNEIATYNTLCMKWHGRCVDNAWLEYLGMGLENSGILLNLSYPISQVGPRSLNLGPSFSEVEFIPGTDVIKEAKVIRLLYSLSVRTQGNDDIGASWEDAFFKHVDEFQKESKLLKLARSNSQALAEEAAQGGLHVMPRFAATFLMMGIFSVVSCLMTDWVLSKPWLGFLGVVSACFAIITTVGLMSFIAKFDGIVALMPFAVLGVGIDNMFIIVAAWRHLSLHLSVEERMGLTFYNAAVSITITNLTDALAFVVGSLTRLPGVRIFCIYAGVSMLFVYIFQMTFFAACMAYIGDREASNRHCYTCRKVRPKKEAPNKFYKVWCAGGISKKSRNIVIPENLVAKFFRVLYGPFIVKPLVKVIVVIGYLVYLGGAIHGWFRISTSLELKSIARDGSPVWLYYDEEELHFTYYGPSVSVVFEGPIHYWEEEIQRKMIDTQKRFTQNDYIFDDERMTSSWMRDFRRHLQMSAPINETDFYQKLEYFIEDPKYRQYTLDLDLVRDTRGAITGITASRFVVMSRNMSSSNRQTDMMLKMREIAQESDFNITVYSARFPIYEQYVGVLPTTLKTLAIAIVCMFIVAILMIPHPICAVSVTLCVISIETAVIGYMSHWEVPLHPMSMVNIILCIGFSVDFAAHITYGYVIAPAEDPNQRSVVALKNLGMPILQGAMSTVIAISVLASAKVYIFRIFFKTLFLVMVFGAFHGLIFLPVFFAYLGRWMPVKADNREQHPFQYARERLDSQGSGTSDKGKPARMNLRDDRDHFCVVESFVSTV